MDLRLQQGLRTCYPQLLYFNEFWDLNSIHILRYCSFCWNFDNLPKKFLLHFYGFSIGYIWGKTNFEKTSPKEFFDAFMIWVWKSGFNSWNQNFRKCTLFVWSTVTVQQTMIFDWSLLIKTLISSWVGIMHQRSLLHRVYIAWLPGGLQFTYKFNLVGRSSLHLKMHQWTTAWTGDTQVPPAWWNLGERISSSSHHSIVTLLVQGALKTIANVYSVFWT